MMTLRVSHLSRRIVQQHDAAILRHALAEVEHVIERTRDAVEGSAAETVYTGAFPNPSQRLARKASCSDAIS
jgi:hypothetical protein